MKTKSKPKINPDKLTSVTIDVNAKRVSKGLVNDSVECPVALAITAVVGKKVDVEVLHDTITLSIDHPDDFLQDDYFHTDTPARASKFILAFDLLDGTPREDQVRPKPFSFKLRIPNRFLKPSLRS